MKKDYLELIRNDKTIAYKIVQLCDIELYEEFQTPEDVNGKLTYSHQGKAFANDGSGGEFILLDDGAVAFCSSEGQTGRIASDLEELFTLLVNCSAFIDYSDKSIFDNLKTLETYAQKAEKDFVDDVEEYIKPDTVASLKKDIAAYLDIKLYDTIAEPVLMKFYNACMQEPLFQSLYHEDDGEVTPSDNLIF